MSEHHSHVEVEIGGEKSFGIVFAVVFTLVALFPLLSGGAPRWWVLAIALVFLLLALFAPRVLALPNRLWFKLGMLLGAIVAPIVMALVYFIAVAPIGLVFRLLGKDLLHQRLDRDAKSYWIDREKPVSTMKDQF